MALQGDLDSFALPDVLRLLAGTAKTGRLDVTGDATAGSVSLDAGAIVGGTVSSAPHAVTAPDVVFELLRLDRGSFRFDDSAAPEVSGPATPVDQAIGEAEKLIEEWDQVSTVVTSVHSWVAITPELSGDEVTIDSEQWRVLSVLGAGATVRDIANHFELTDLVASRQVKGLVEAGLVDLTGEPTASIASGPAPADPTPAPDLEADAGQHHDFNVDDLHEADDIGLEHRGGQTFLDAEDGPVVLETSEDALLPEPLPGESTTFEGDLSELGSVDSHNLGEQTRTGTEFGADPGSGEFGSPYDPGHDDPSAELITPSDPDDPLVDPFSSAWDDPVAAQAAAQQSSAPNPLAEADLQDEERAWSAFTSGDEMVDHLAQAEGTDSTEDPNEDESGGESGGEGDRGSLLKFLSTVKP